MRYKIYRYSTNFPTLLFIHGFLGSASDWDAIVFQLGTHFNYITINLPGHSGSLNSSVSFSLISYQIAQILNSENINEIIIVGYSLGGRIALHFAHHYPMLIKKMVLISAHLGLSRWTDRVKRESSDHQLAQRMCLLYWTQFLENWYDSPLFAVLKRHLVYKKVLVNRHLNCPDALSKVLIALSLAYQPYYIGMLQRSLYPIYYLCGEKDDKFYQLSQQYRDFLTVDACSGADHALHLTHPEWLANHLLSFCTIS